MTKKPDKFHAHEVVHTSSIIEAMWCDHVSSNSFTSNNLKLLRKAEEVEAAMADFYQLAAIEADNTEPK